MSPKQRKINAKAAKRRVLEYLKEQEKTAGKHQGIVGCIPGRDQLDMITHWIITVKFSEYVFRKYKVLRTDGRVFPIG